MAKVSIVIPCVNGLPGIDECLKALERQRGDIDYETIVANRCSDGTSEHIQRHFPDVRVLDFREPISIPELRAHAMDAAHGDIIAVTEDHCIAGEEWLSEIVRAMDRGYMVVGGSIENGKTDRILDWSAFLCEYSAAMPPIPDGEVTAVPGNNVAYRREALALLPDRVRRYYWEYFMLAELQHKGIRFLSVPSMNVIHRKTFGFRYFIGQCFCYSRSFAGMRSDTLSSMSRYSHALAMPMILFLRWKRITLSVLRKRRCYREFLLSVPSLMVFLLAHTIGESVGYLFGPGESLIRVE